MFTIDRILDLTKKRGLKQSYLCTQLGLERSWIQNVKRHNSTISDERLIQLADILGTTVEYLKGETDDPAPAKEKSPSELDELLSQPDVTELLALYRSLTPGEQRQALSVLKALKDTE